MNIDEIMLIYDKFADFRDTDNIYVLRVLESLSMLSNYLNDNNYSDLKELK